MIGQRLGSFRIDERLGGGSMWTVYRAVNVTTGKAAAIEVLGSKDQDTVARFQRAADILAQLRHPNITRFLASGRHQGVDYFAREYIAGPSLAHVLAERGSLPWREVVGLGLQICEALRYIHERGVVHRDLKPSHLLLTDEGTVKLIGFGLAMSLELAIPLTGCGRVLGTAGYMAPEQIRGTPAISHKTDLYALGAVFYEMLTGLPVFERTSAVALMFRHLSEAPSRPSSKVRETPVALDGLIVQLMAKAPADRPEDATDVANVLSQLRDNELHKPVDKALKPLRRQLWLWPFSRQSRQIARGASPDSSPEDTLWDRELDA